MIDLEKLPREPGCYLYKDRDGRIIYVGKAKDLRKRVSSYFTKNDLDPKTASMVGNIADLDYIITGNELEALILENNLIKKNLPKYNINLRDSKRYAYIMLTKEEFPRLVIARRKIDDGIYFGPFTSAEKRDALLRMASSLLKMRKCKKLPKKACLRAHMGSCTAPCIKKVSKEEYGVQAGDAKLLLSGRNKELLRDLKDRMAKASARKEYEQAKILRDQIAGIEFLQEKQSMETDRAFDQDIINYIVDGEKVHLSVFNAERGILSNKDEYEFDYRPGFLEEFILQYYDAGDIPKEIILPEDASDALASYLSEKRGTRVRIIVPQKGEKKDLLDLVKKNVEKLYLEDDLALQDLREKLGLEKTPRAIECFDISHIQGSDSVGSMVRFLEGKPDKSNYRRFKIRTIDGIDDPAMIAEVVGRRYRRLKEEKKEFPDLIVIDGGRTQLSAAHRELQKLSLRIPVIGLAKKMEEIYFPGLAEPQRFDHKTRAIRLLQNIRDEAHRFAIKYHKVLRSKRIVRKGPG
ncbi:MAG: excinuclease ABC subunit UvrC [Candidatus Altiarchaeia archaeon]